MIYKLRDCVRSENATIIDKYLCAETFYHLELLLRSTDTATAPIGGELARLTNEFCAAEEKRLTENLDQDLAGLNE
ncbi:hypothetical protein DXG01_014800 [Tephrocybe rancida]|nr:hypothetical protein DXG01_014800 [Tephrocybe rancida]